MTYPARIEELAELAGRDDKEVQKLVENAYRYPEFRESAEQILIARCRRKGINLGKEPVFDVPEDLPEDGKELGEVLLGDTPAGIYRHPNILLPGNQGVFGASGSGKSSIVGLQCEGWIEDGLCVVIFDLADEYGWLIHRFPAEKLLVLRARDFPLGMYVNPEGSSLSEMAWLSRVTGVLREIAYLRDGSCHLHNGVVGNIYHKRGVLDGNRDYPLASDVYTALAGKRFGASTRSAGFLESLLNRLQGLLLCLPGINAKHSLKVGQILGRSLIIRMSDLSPSDMDAFISFFLSWFMAVMEGRIRKQVVAVLVMEEVHLLVSRQKMKRSDLGEPLIVRHLRTARKYGVSTIVLDQSPSELPAALLGNVSSRIVFRLTNSPCIRAISHSMGLDNAQITEMAELLPRRVVIQSAKIPRPFMIEVLQIPERYRPSERELRQREEESLALLDYEFADVNVQDVLLGIKSEEKEEVQDERDIRGDMRRVMERICKAPHESIEERAEALGIDRSCEGRARGNLKKLGMIELGDKVGAKWQLYVPTSKGIKWAEDMGLPVHHYKSGVGHERMLMKVREALGSFSQRVAFVSAGEGLGVTNIQPDLVVRVRMQGGSASRIVVIQISCSNKLDYEAKKALGLCQIRQIDMVIIVAKNKGARKVLEEKIRDYLNRETARSNQKSFRGSVVHPDIFGSGASYGPIVLDFETCVSATYDWTWVVG